MDEFLKRWDALLARPCADCGETGRSQKWLDYQPYCHDEEKSCFNYVNRISYRCA